PPPAEITRYCLPLTTYVLGVAYPAEGSWYSQSTRPECDSNARIFASAVAAMNVIPPAVVTGPPKFIVPVFRIPFATNSGYSPSGTFQRMSPLFRSMAFKVPQGGEIPGNPWASVSCGYPSIEKRRAVGLVPVGEVSGALFT